MTLNINARLLKHNSLSGIPRYIQGILKGLDARNFEYTLLYPDKKLNVIKAHLWEQFILPGRSKNSLLWSPANSGPFRVHNQVVTVHDVLHVDRPDLHVNSFLAGKLYKFMYPRLFKNCLGILTVSNYTKSRIMELYKIPSEKIKVVYETPADIFKPCSESEIKAVREKYKLTQDRGYVLSLGSLDIKKNLKNLIKAWQILDNYIKKDFDLILSGQEVERMTLERLELDKIPDGVKFTGFVDDKDLPALYSGASLFIFPSLYEGFGLPPVEAMSCGAPVIVSNATSLPEICGDGALQVDPYDIESIAAGIKSVLEDNSLAESLRAKGLARSKFFSWEHEIDEHIEFFRRFI